MEKDQLPQAHDRPADPVCYIGHDIAENIDVRKNPSRKRQHFIIRHKICEKVNADQHDQNDRSVSFQKTILTGSASGEMLAIKC